MKDCRDTKKREEASARRGRGSYDGDKIRERECGTKRIKTPHTRGTRESNGENLRRDTGQRGVIISPLGDLTLGGKRRRRKRRASHGRVL